MKKVSIILVGGMLLIGSVSFAKDKGETGAAFLKIGVGAKAGAMGEAYTGLADDVTATYWNPAGLAQLEERQALFMYHTPMTNVDDLSYNYLNIAIPNEIGVIGISIYYFDYGEMDEHRDDDGLVDGRWDASDISAAFSIGRQIKENLAVGGTFKGIRGKIADKKANSAAVDLGLLYDTNTPGLTLGAVIKNIGSKIKYEKQSDNLPLALKCGLGYHYSTAPVTLVCDVTLPNDNNAYIGFGAEYLVKEIFALRAGYKSGPQDEGSGLTAGFGLKYSAITFDYAYQPYDELGNSHYVSIQTRF